MRCSYLVHVLVDVAAGDGGVGDKVKELSDRHHRHTVLHKEVWMEAQDVILNFRGGGGWGHDTERYRTIKTTNHQTQEQLHPPKSCEIHFTNNCHKFTMTPLPLHTECFFVIYCREFILLCILF